MAVSVQNAEPDRASRVRKEMSVNAIGRLKNAAVATPTEAAPANAERANSRWTGLGVAERAVLRRTGLQPETSAWASRRWSSTRSQSIGPMSR